MLQRKLATVFFVASIALVASAALWAQTPSQPQDRESQQQQQQSQSHSTQPRSTTQAQKDEQFVETMTQHHQTGIEMARLEEDQGASSTVKRLAGQIRKNEERRLNELTKLSRNSVGNTGTGSGRDTGTGTGTQRQGSTTDRQGSSGSGSSQPGSTSGTGQQGSTTPGQGQSSTRQPGLGSTATMEQQSQAMLDRLKSLTGEELDRAFLEEMAEHHRMGIHAAEMASLQDPTLDRLSQKSVDEQRKELEQIEQAQSSMSSRK